MVSKGCVGALGHKGGNSTGLVPPLSSGGNDEGSDRRAVGLLSIQRLPLSHPRPQRRRDRVLPCRPRAVRERSRLTGCLGRCEVALSCLCSFSVVRSADPPS